MTPDRTDTLPDPPEPAPPETEAPATEPPPPPEPAADAPGPDEPDSPADALAELLAHVRAALERRTREVYDECMAMVRRGERPPPDLAALAQTHGPGLVALLDGAPLDYLLADEPRPSVFRTAAAGTPAEFAPADLTFETLNLTTLADPKQQRYVAKLKANAQNDRATAAALLTEVVAGFAAVAAPPGVEPAVPRVEPSPQVEEPPPVPAEAEPGPPPPAPPEAGPAPEPPPAPGIPAEPDSPPAAPDVLDDVARFLAAADSPAGAPLGLLTDAVLAWLRMSGRFDTYRIRR